MYIAKVETKNERRHLKTTKARDLTPGTEKNVTDSAFRQPWPQQSPHTAEKDRHHNRYGGAGDVAVAETVAKTGHRRRRPAPPCPDLPGGRHDGGNNRGHHDRSHHDRGHHDRGHHDRSHHDRGHHDRGHHDRGHHDRSHHDRRGHHDRGTDDGDGVFSLTVGENGGT